MEPSKAISQWLDAATRGIRFGPDRRAVRAELEAHLEDKALDLQRIFPDKRLNMTDHLKILLIHIKCAAITLGVIQHHYRYNVAINAFHNASGHGFCGDRIR